MNKSNIETVLDFISANYAEEYETLRETQTEEQCSGHIYAVAKQAREDLDNTLDEVADSISLDDRRLLKAEAFLRERILPHIKIERAGTFQLDGNKATTMISLETNDPSYKKPMEVFFEDDSAQIKEVKFLTALFK